MELNLSGKKVLVTGGSRGLGRDIAIKIRGCHAKVIVIGRNIDLLKSLKDEYPDIETIAHDITDWSSTQKLVNDLGPIDILVNNAGVGSLEDVGSITPENFDICFSTNVRALINISQTVANNMKKAKIVGSIINISSQASQAALPLHTVYCAAKAAVDAVTRSMSLELGPHNIRVNSVNPTVVLTEMGKMAWSDPQKGDPMKAKIPLGHFAEEEDVSNAVIFLASDKSKMINGVSLPIDGGFLAC